MTFACWCSGRASRELANALPSRGAGLGGPRLVLESRVLGVSLPPQTGPAAAPGARTRSGAPATPGSSLGPQGGSVAVGRRGEPGSHGGRMQVGAGEGVYISGQRRNHSSDRETQECRVSRASQLPALRLCPVGEAGGAWECLGMPSQENEGEERDG